MLIHLDTNYLIRAADARSLEAARLRAWLADQYRLGISAAAWAEFLCGPVSATNVRAASDLAGPPVSFGAREAALAADCFNAAGRRRGLMVDCMIAATAIAAGADLATANVADFERLAPLGLRLAR